MARLERIERTVEGSQHTKETDLTLVRMAGGSAVDRLCRAMTQQASSYEEVDVRGPGEKYKHQSRLEIVDTRAIRMNKLRMRGVTPRRLHFALTHLVPSVLEEKPITATTVGSGDNYQQEYFLALHFNDDHTEALTEERQKVWEVIGKLGDFSVHDIPWLKRPQDLRLA